MCCFPRFFSGDASGGREGDEMLVRGHRHIRKAVLDSAIFPEICASLEDREDVGGRSSISALDGADGEGGIEDLRTTFPPSPSARVSKPLLLLWRGPVSVPSLGLGKSAILGVIFLRSSVFEQQGGGWAGSAPGL